MSFDRQQPDVPTSIDEIRITIADPNGVPANMKAGYFVRVLDQNGGLFKELSGDLILHLTPTQINGLLQLMQDLRALAVSEILPAP